MDLRNQDTVTIDGEDAKDLDVAITLNKTAEGEYELGVHIADVSIMSRNIRRLIKKHSIVGQVFI